jgi:soluble lytic murein transglycosylase-like protein
MSAEPVAATGGSAAAGDPQQAAARVAQIQQLIDEAVNGFNSSQATSSSTGSGDFSSMLASAASAGATPDTAAIQASAGSYAPIIDAAAAQYGLNPSILTALVHQESGFDPNAVSSAGAEGLTQVMPENFAADGITDPFDPTQSIDGGAEQLSEDLQQFGGNYADALAAYNAGAGAVEQYGGVPPYAQTQNYVQDILAYAQQLQNQPALPTTASITPESGATT